MEILLIRHGATGSNLQRRYLGRTDEPLCPEGLAALRPLDQSLELVFVSPLLRARQTAAVLFPNARQSVVAGLREMDFGAFEGRTADELSEDAAYRAWVDGGCEGACPGGESRSQFCRRTTAAFAQLVDCALARDASRLAIVAHGGTIMAVGEGFAVPRRPYFAWQADNGAAVRFFTDAGLWAARQILSESEA